MLIFQNVFIIVIVIFFTLKSVLEENNEYKIEKDEEKCVVQRAPSNLKISSVFSILGAVNNIKPVDNSKPAVGKLEPGVIKATTTKNPTNMIKIMTPSQINKPLGPLTVDNKTLGSPKSFIIGRVRNTTVSRFVPNQPNKASVTSQPASKVIIHPKKEETVPVSPGTHVKFLENENQTLRRLLRDVRQESVGNSVEF